MIHIFKSSVNYFVWTADEACKLRKEHLLMAPLVGCMPRFPLQNNTLSLPLFLSPLEARLAVEEGFGVLVDENDVTKVKNHARKVNQKRKLLYQEQIGLAREDKMKNFEMRLDRIMEGKKKKMMKKLMSTRTTKTTPTTNTNNNTAPNTTTLFEPLKNVLAIDGKKDGKEKREEIEKEMEKKENENMKVAIEMEEKGKREKDEIMERMGEGVKEGVEEGVEKGVEEGVEERVEEGVEELVNRTLRDEIEEERKKIMSSELPEELSLVQLHTARFPEEKIKKSSLLNDWCFERHLEIKYHVFRHFWRLKYCLSSALKFGGDFLVYPGDSCRYHSCFIVLCVDRRGSQKYGNLDVVRMGRMATTVKKTFLLAAVDLQKDGEVECIAIKWKRKG